MAKKVKVWNRNRHHVGVTFMNGIGRDIAPNSFIMPDEDEVAIWMSTTSLFSGKHLSFDDAESAENLGVTLDEVNYETDEEISNKLKKSTVPALKKYLAEVTELHVKNRIRDIAKECDLPASKLSVVEDILGVEVYTKQ